MLTRLRSAIHRPGCVKLCLSSRLQRCTPVSSLTGLRETCSVAGFHDTWQCRLYDTENQRSYALNLGHFFQERSLGPASALSFQRVDHAAGRPRTVKPQLKDLLYSATRDSTLRGPITALCSQLNLVLEDSGYALLISAEGESAGLWLQTEPTYIGSKPLSPEKNLLHHKGAELRLQSLQYALSSNFCCHLVAVRLDWALCASPCHFGRTLMPQCIAFTLQV